jgi:DNA mismatch endonuclease (patch repair protein)
MRAIRSRGTRPELLVRRILLELGFRYRLHRRDLPGTPDVVIGGIRVALFVHGCFWHRHDCPNGRAAPANRREFWRAKFLANLRRDRKVHRRLERQGWRVVIVWECEVASDLISTTRDRLRRDLSRVAVQMPADRRLRPQDFGDDIVAAPDRRSEALTKTPRQRSTK